MSLSSIGFWGFLGLVVFLYHATRGRLGVGGLLAFSLIFYGAFGEPLWFGVLAVVAVLTWAFGLWIQGQAAPAGGRRLALLWTAVGLDLILLAACKYSGLIALGINALLGLSGFVHRLPVPEPLVFLGLSYYVFQSISYLADIYFGTLPAEPRFAWVALYLTFFPKMMQGPIERAGDFFAGLRRPYTFDPDRLRAAALRFAWGLFKKVIIAERLSAMVDRVFAALPGQGGPVLWATAWLFALQLYADFSGYTDMALGAAGLLNLPLAENFDRPWLSRSMRDFWRRWHITLSKFILDYVFQPLQVAFRRRGAAGLAAALFIAFFLMGLWHGATPAFVVFGLVQGLYMAASVIYRPLQKRLHGALGITKAPWLGPWQIFFTLHLVVFSFVLFRAGSMANAVEFYRGLLGGWTSRPDFGVFFGGAQDRTEGLVLAAGLGLEAAVLVLMKTVGPRRLPWIVRWSGYAGWMWFLLLFGRFYAQKQFIYAQF